MAAPVRSADSFYVEDCRQAQHHTHTIQTLTGEISRLVGSLRTDDDFAKCRKLVDQAVSKASETRTILLRIHEYRQHAQNAAEKNNRRMMYNKLSDNLAITARVLEDVVRRLNAEVEKKHLQVGNRASASAPAPSDTHAPQPLLGQEVDEMDLDRQASLQRVDEDMRCLKQIYTDLATAAEEQQASLDSIEEHMSNAATDLERGVHQLDMGKYDLERFRRRKMMAAGAAAVVAMTTAIVALS